MKNGNKKVEKSLSNGGITSKKIAEKSPTNSEQELEQLLQELESPDYAGEGFWSLPENPTALEKSKYDICQKILAYQQDNNLPIEEVANKIQLTKLFQSFIFS